ncbi:MAG: hypothetical protein OXB84_01850 [Halobacteriovoraceae bacterium]|nr:hypothetical protein [Halobacteriovoraceae bacterium]
MEKKQNGVPQELWDLMTKTFKGIAELRDSQKEYAREMKESKLETDRQMKETDQRLEKRLSKLSKSIDKANGNFNNKWGEFMEKLVEGDLINLLKSRSIEVISTHPRIKIKDSKNNIVAEFDLVAVNGKEIVVVEVKTSLEVSDVRQFIKKLTAHKGSLGFQGKTIYAGVAFLSATKEALNLAVLEGLFTLQAPGGEAKVSKITNSKDFKPKSF